MCKYIGKVLHRWLNYTRVVDFLAPLALRLYLAPLFWMAGTSKWQGIDNTIRWFGNSDWGLGLPFPTLLAYLATITEIVGAICLFIGLAVRWISFPLMIVMLVAAFAVHWDQGWHVIAPDSAIADLRLDEFMDWLGNAFPQRHAHITEHGNPVILNNGIEFAATYFIMLLTLFFIGAGKYLSVDHWFDRWLYKDK